MIGADPRADVAREEAQPLDAIGERAELVVIDDPGEPLDACRERLPAVLVEEETRVGKPRSQHALVAAHDRARVLCRQIADHQEAVRQHAARVGEREILLVLLHRQDQAFLRHGEEFRIERAGVDGGPFDQRGHFVEQRVGHDDRRAFGCRLRAGARSRRAVARIGQHLALRLERGCIGVGGFDGDVVARQEAMARGHVVRRQAERRDAEPRARRAARAGGARGARTRRRCSSFRAPDSASPWGSAGARSRPSSASCSARPSGWPFARLRR